jgi:hypothetical protein
MDHLPLSIIATIAVLTMFLVFITAIKYAVRNDFLRMRLMMTAFFFYIVAALTISFWPYALESLPFTAPAALLGALMGRVVGVRAAEHRLHSKGIEHYMEHFAHLHSDENKKIVWWSIINFYTVMSALILVNFIGLSTVIFSKAHDWAIVSSAFGALLLGTIAPYLVHLWSIQTRHTKSSSTSER